MNRQENTCYQYMAQFVRTHQIRGGWGWPGKAVSAPAETRYPNILAEMDASFTWLHLLAEFSGVSPDVMAAIVEDNEEMSALEMRGLARYIRVSMGYLASPRLSMIDSATNKGRARLRQLSDLMQQTEGLDISMMWSIEQTRDAMERGELVTYASWRWACQEINDALEYRRNTERKRRTTRMERMVTI